MQIPYRALRWIHALGSPFIGAFVYSPSLRHSAEYVLLLQAGVFPLITAVGLWMWLGPRLFKSAHRPGSSQPPGARA